MVPFGNMFELPRLVLALIAILGFLALLGFAAVSVCERERRASIVATVLSLVPLSIATAAWVLPLDFAGLALKTLFAVFVATVLWVVFPRRTPAPGGTTDRRVDERDIMFARGRLEPGTQKFEDYYELRPDNLASDDRTRALPGLLSSEAEFAEPVAFEAAKASFKVTEALRDEVDGPVSSFQVQNSPESWSEAVKNLTTYFGAHSVGIARIEPQHIYTNIGRGSGTWGAPVDLPHTWAIAFSVEMDFFNVSHAPEAPIVMESARQYVNTAVIALQVATAIRALGYPARAHIDGNYRVIAPLVARDAGLGELGRMGLLMTPTLGPRVRLGIVTTDLPLVPDGRKDDRSVLHFCSICKKCADSCPVGSIPSGERVPIKGGGQRWKIDDETCYRYWAVAGTDCGTCMRVCPYSHPDNGAHNLVRWAIRHLPGARRPLLLLDDLFYGRSPKPRHHASVGAWKRF